MCPFKVPYLENPSSDLIDMCSYQVPYLEHPSSDLMDMYSYKMPYLEHPSSDLMDMCSYQMPYLEHSSSDKFVNEYVNEFVNAHYVIDKGRSFKNDLHPPFPHLPQNFNRLPPNLKSSSFITLVVAPAMAIKKSEVFLPGVLPGWIGMGRPARSKSLACSSVTFFADRKKRIAKAKNSIAAFEAWQRRCICGGMHLMIGLTLWNEMATEFDIRAYEQMEKPVIIVVTSCCVTRYNACGHKVKQQPPFPMCKDHGPQTKALYSYCFKAIVGDGSATVSITCFSDQANSLTRDCNDVLAELSDNDPYHLPMSLKELEGTTHTFQFYFDTGSTDKRPDFVSDTVFKPPTPLLPPSISIQSVTPESGTTHSNVLRFDSEAGKFGTKGIPAHGLFSFEEVKNAANNFHISILIGEGSTVKLMELYIRYQYDMIVDEAAELARRSIYHATFRDGSSGGVASGISRKSCLQESSGDDDEEKF
ncbi:DNA helicase [Tanacetum coccineum]|uniref:DNA helicase n=1 Tax=Tanacetum coccineum TaxID=301880 RepID=A0ABQ5DLF6_9ASTR